MQAGGIGPSEKLVVTLLDRADSRRASNYDLSMLPPALVERVNQVQALTRSLQSKVDRTSGGQKRKYEDDNNDGGQGKKQVKGKGKGNKKGKQRFKTRGWKNNQKR